MNSGRSLPSHDAALAHVKWREMNHRAAAHGIGSLGKRRTLSFNDRIGTVAVGHLDLIEMTGFVDFDDAANSLNGGTFCHGWVALFSQRIPLFAKIICRISR
jgi:hypothetical protein